MTKNKRITDKELNSFRQGFRIAGIIYGAMCLIFYFIVMMFFNRIFIEVSIIIYFILFSTVGILFILIDIIIGMRKILKELSNIKKELKKKR